MPEKRPVVFALLSSPCCLAGEDIRLILPLHAGDLEIPRSINRAATEMLDKGAISSASIMMAGPRGAEIADYAERNPGNDLGLHLTLASEWEKLRWRPVAPCERVPSLCES